MSDSLKFSSSNSGRPQTASPQASLHTCEPRGASCQQMAESQESSSFCLRPAAASRRHSADATPADSDRFHPYLRQFSDGAATADGRPSHYSPSFGRPQEGGPDRGDGAASWEGYEHSMQFSYPEVPAVPGEPSCFQAQSYAAFFSSSLQQASCRPYPSSVQSHSPKYPVESLPPPSLGRSPPPSIFPKPIYSYSILIFMALKNSKTGSLPVSEIYSFMTEHFPYFKTAPDGWKNSVRHNLSLNKCFEKVENKNGNSSRKGCLWALNPVRVEKMQEELHKWRRKDPLTVRRSMARPEDLDHLLGEKPSKLRPLPPYISPALASRVAPMYSAPSTPRAAAPPTPGRAPHYLQHPHQPQQASYSPLPSSFASSSFAPYSPGGQQPEAGVPSPPGLHSPTVGKMPPPYSAALQAECGAGRRGVQELLPEGELTYDVDTLNPSLTDLQLQGNLWEELREDSLPSDLQAVTSTAPPHSPDPHLYTSCVQAVFPVGYGTEAAAAAVARCRAEGSGRGPGSEQPGCVNGLQGGPYSGMDGLSGFLACCTTSISLM